ncbi:MAG: MogA/MoaB family molybdenum cofactor biosynthesis protein [bacterium]
MSHNQKLSPEDIRIQLFTLSDTRKVDDDESGRLMKKYLGENSFRIAGADVLREDIEILETNFKQAIADNDIQVVIASGGTGITTRDRTVEVVRQLSDFVLPGFGELFRRLSYEDIGTNSILSRSLAAKADKTIVVCLPGSPGAVKLAFEEILLEALPHMVEMANE